MHLKQTNIENIIQIHILVLTKENKTWCRGYRFKNKQKNKTK